MGPGVRSCSTRSYLSGAEDGACDVRSVRTDGRDGPVPAPDRVIAVAISVRSASSSWSSAAAILDVAVAAAHAGSDDPHHGFALLRLRPVPFDDAVMPRGVDQHGPAHRTTCEAIVPKGVAGRPVPASGRTRIEPARGSPDRVASSRPLRAVVM